MIAARNFTAGRDASRRIPVVTRAARLLIGYGNELRSDDGAGIRAVEMIAVRDLLARVITCHQLTPELADDIAAAAQVVFVDAYVANERGAGLRIERIGDGDACGACGACGASAHRSEPAALLELARRLHGSVPDAWMIGIPAYCFEAGEVISRATAQRVDEVVAWFGK